MANLFSNVDIRNLRIKYVNDMFFSPLNSCDKSFVTAFFGNVYSYFPRPLFHFLFSLLAFFFLCLFWSLWFFCVGRQCQVRFSMCTVLAQLVDEFSFWVAYNIEPLVQIIWIIGGFTRSFLVDLKWHLYCVLHCNS